MSKCIFQQPVKTYVFITFLISKKFQMKLIFIAGLIFTFTGCVPVQVTKDQQIVSKAENGGKVVVLLNRSGITGIDDPEEFEEKITDCIKEELSELTRPIEVVSAERFRHFVFPGTDDQLIPNRPESFVILLESSDFQRKIKQLDIHHFIIVDAIDRIGNKKLHEGMPIPICSYQGCDVIPGYFFWTWDKRTLLRSTVIDTVRKQKIGDIGVKSIARPFMGFVLMAVPIGMPAFTSGPGCRAFGKEIASFFQNQ